jgi:hypothetical protein
MPEIYAKVAINPSDYLAKIMIDLPFFTSLSEKIYIAMH